ncbi:MAG: hypothetical protein KC561_16100, partial [Myxococcales bacterium]|nr:hypothetical protein [Myxococcales bacterium]
MLQPTAPIQFNLQGSNVQMAEDPPPAAAVQIRGGEAVAKHWEFEGGSGGFKVAEVMQGDIAGAPEVSASPVASATRESASSSSVASASHTASGDHGSVSGSAQAGGAGTSSTAAAEFGLKSYELKYDASGNLTLGEAKGSAKVSAGAVDFTFMGENLQMQGGGEINAEVAAKLQGNVSLGFQAGTSGLTLSSGIALEAGAAASGGAKAAASLHWAPPGMGGTVQLVAGSYGYS